MKIRKLLFLSIFLILGLVVFMPNTVNADVGGTFSDNGFNYEILTEGENKTVKITGYTGSDTDIVIPSKVNGYTITEIGDSAMKNLSITSVTFQDDSKIEVIGANAFDACGELVSVNNLPDTLTTIGKNAFRRCSKLENIILPDSLTTLGLGAFYYCSALKSITIPENIVEVSHTFQNCTNLEKVTFKGKMTSLGNYTFDYCKNLTEIKFEKGYSINNIGRSLFLWCQNLNLDDFYIQDGVSNIGSNAFDNCDKLTKLILPVSVAKVGTRAFDGCSALKELWVLNEECEIGNNVLINCPSDLIVYGFENSTIDEYVGTSYTFKEIYRVTNTLTNITSNGLSYAHKDLGDYTTTLVANAGYELPEIISIKVNGINLSSDEYEYNSENGNLKINAEKIDGNIEIEAFGEKIIKVSFDGNGGEFSGETKKIEYDNMKDCDFSNLAVPTMDGYKFIGYYTKDGKSIDEIMNSEEGFVEDTIFYAKWELIYTYTFIVGGSQTFTLNKIDKYSFEIDGDYNLFSKLIISNLNLEKDVDFKVTEGSTIITFTETGLAKLNTLAVGNYDVVVEYTNDKKVTGKLIIEADKTLEDNKEDNTDNTNTGNSNTDNTNTGNINTGNTNTDNTNTGNTNTGNSNTDNTNTDNTNTNKATGNNPQTSDNIILFVTILGVSIIGLTVTTRIRKNLKKI